MKQNKHFFSTLLFSLLAFSLLFSSCSRKSEKTTESSEIKICATFYPLYIMLMNITENVPGIQLSLLAPANTGCLHDYQLTTRDMKSITDCDILIANGAGMEDFLEKAISIKKENTIVAAEGFTLVDDNAHVWVSPKGAAYEVKSIADGLCRLDAKNADTYRNNAASYINKLNAVSDKMHSELKQYAGTKVITFHEAFPYFTAEFYLDCSAVIEREPGEEPSPKELVELIDLIKEKQSDGSRIALFAEPQYSPSSAQIIARETGLTVFELDPSVTGDLTKDAYLNAMEKNLSVLKEAFSK